MKKISTQLTRRDALRLAPTAVAATALTSFISAPSSEAAATKYDEAKLTPGFFKQRVGDAIVTSLLDGYIDIQPEWWINISQEELREGLAKALLPADQPVRISVNAYVVEIAGRTIAIDAGSRDLFGPTAGNHIANFEAAGFKRETIDTVVLTHMHPDHIGGLLTMDGAPMFPNAEIVGQSSEHSYWTSDSARSAAPDSAKSWFDEVSEFTAVYDGRIRLIDGEQEAVPGLHTVALNGHTPGHVGYVLDSNNEQLFFWADVTDQTSLQLNNTDRSLIFDIDPVAGTAARNKAIAMALDERLPIAGSHVPFPSFGRILKHKGEIRYQPTEWTYEL